MQGSIFVQLDSIFPPVSYTHLLLQPFNAPEIAVFDSSTSHYRMRAEFRIWHDKGDFYHIMFDQSTLQRYRDVYKRQI